MKPTVLVTGARAPVALDLARACAAAGHEVWLADSAPAYAARWSKQGQGRVLTLPPARHAFTAYAEALRDWLHAHPGAIVLPTCEEVFYVAHAAARHGVASQVFAPNPDVLRRVHSKIEFAQWASALGIDTPRTVAVASPREAIALRRDHGDWVFKPEFSRFGLDALMRPSAARLERLDASAARRWAAQEFVEGDEICLWTAAREGRVVASVAYRPVWRLGRSASFAFEAIDAPAALAVARTVAQAARVTGQLSFDFIVRADGRAVPIECNPRAVSGVHLFKGEAPLADAMLSDGPPVHVTQGFAYLGPAMLLLGLPQALARGAWRQWQGDWRRGDESLHAAGGSGAVAGALLDAARFAGGALSRSRSATRETTDDIEWNGETPR